MTNVTKTSAPERHVSGVCSINEHNLCLVHCECNCHYMVTSALKGKRDDVLTIVAYELWSATRAGHQVRQVFRIVEKALKQINYPYSAHELDAVTNCIKETVFNKDSWSRADFHKNLANVEEHPTLF